MSTLIRGCLPGQDTPTDIVVGERGHVESVTEAGRERADVGGRTAHIIPPLFDIQVNGLDGIDLQSPDLAVEQIAAIGRGLARNGVGYWIPTLITAGAASLRRLCHVFAEAMEDKAIARAVPGIHLEGPYISPEDGPRGAHARTHVRKPSLAEFDRLQAAAHGYIRYVTLAPEWKNAPAFIRGLRERGVSVSLGHHNATEEQILRAVEAGATLCTHLGNGMASPIPRHANPLWPQLANDALTASFIADLEHLPPASLKSMLRAKGPERAILTSDCVHITGLPPGHYHLGEMPVELLPSGRICLSGTVYLAGSSLMLLQGLVNAVRVGGLTMRQAVASATTIPAQALGLKQLIKRFAPPTVGARPHFVVFDIVNGRPKIHAVYIDGCRMDK